MDRQVNHCKTLTAHTSVHRRPLQMFISDLESTDSKLSGAKFLSRLNEDILRVSKQIVLDSRPAFLRDGVC